VASLAERGSGTRDSERSGGTARPELLEAWGALPRRHRDGGRLDADKRLKSNLHPFTSSWEETG